MTAGAAAWAQARRFGEGLLSLLSPEECAACGSGVQAGAFCEACAIGLCECDPAICATCTAPAIKNGLCRRCRLRLRPLDGAICAYEYTPPLSDAIARLKYEGHDELAGPLAGCFARGLEGRLEALSPPALLTAVPLHGKRLRQRGFDQSWLLARGLWSALPEPRPEAVPRLLRRVRHTPAQVGLGRWARERNVQAAFEARSAASRARISGRAVLLIDDVLTTGATLRAAAEALHAAGARSVFGVTLARALT